MEPSRPNPLTESRWSPDHVFARLLAPERGPRGDRAVRQAAAEGTATLFGEFAPALELLPQKERERAELLGLWTASLFAAATASEPPERRIEALHHFAFLAARALGGEPTESAFLAGFAVESTRRDWTRDALDRLLAAARERSESPRPRDGPDLARRTRNLAAALLDSLLGVASPPPAIDFASGVMRLAGLERLPRDLARQRAALPLDALPEPLQYRRREEIAAAIEHECEAVRQLLLRGARAAVEVPLSYRRPFAYLLPASLALLGAIEEDPERAARRASKLGGWRRRWLLFRARRASLD